MESGLGADKRLRQHQPSATSKLPQDLPHPNPQALRTDHIIRVPLENEGDHRQEEECTAKQAQEYTLGPGTSPEGELET